MVNCCVNGCHHRSGKASSANTSFYRLPAVSGSESYEFRTLTFRRRELWLIRINRGDHPAGARVCSNHFISGNYCCTSHDIEEVSLVRDSRLYVWGRILLNFCPHPRKFLKFRPHYRGIPRY